LRALVSANSFSESGRAVIPLSSLSNSTTDSLVLLVWTPPAEYQTPASS
jgi:hypothetical protein